MKQLLSILCAVISKILFSFDMLKIKKKFFCILHMLSIHTGLWKLSKTNVYDLILKKNLFDIGLPCIKIARNELFFEIYIMALNHDKYDIEVRNDDAIKRNQRFFDFMQRTFNCLDRLYLHERFILIDAIVKDQLSNQSEAEIEKLNREKNSRNKRKEGKYKPSPKNLVL